MTLVIYNQQFPGDYFLLVALTSRARISLKLETLNNLIVIVSPPKDGVVGPLLNSHSWLIKMWGDRYSLLTSLGIPSSK